MCVCVCVFMCMCSPFPCLYSLFKTEDLLAAFQAAVGRQSAAIVLKRFALACLFVCLFDRLKMQTRLAQLLCRFDC